MSKFGVGVGDDFPVDDPGFGTAKNSDPNHSDREEFETWKRRRDEYRSQREAYRRQREEWHSRKRAFKEKVRQAARDSFGPRGGEREYAHYYGWRRRGNFPFFVWPAIGLLIPILILAVVVSLIAAIFKSPFAFLALMALAIGFFMWRHGHRHDYGYDGGYRDYDFDLKPSTGGRQDSPPPNAPSPQSGGATVTPPPSGEGKSAT